MGKCHALAWNAVKTVFGDVERPRLVHLAEANAELAAQARVRVRLRKGDRRLAHADRRSRKSMSFPSPRPTSSTPRWRLPRSRPASMSGARSRWRLPMPMPSACSQRAQASGKVAVLGYNYIQNPVDPAHQDADRGRGDRRRQSYPRRDGRGLHGRSATPSSTGRASSRPVTARWTISPSIRCRCSGICSVTWRLSSPIWLKPYADRPPRRVVAARSRITMPPMS